MAGTRAQLNALNNIKISIPYRKSNHDQIFRAVEVIDQKLILIFIFKKKKIRQDSRYPCQYSNSRPDRGKNQSEIKFNFKFEGKKFRLDSRYSGQYSNSRPGRRRNQSEINFKFHLKKKIQAGQSVFRPIFEMKTY